MLALGLGTPLTLLTTVHSRAAFSQSRPDGPLMSQAAGVSAPCSPLCIHHSLKLWVAQVCMALEILFTEALEYPFACAIHVKNEN